MQENNFQLMISTIYATFGKSTPSGEIRSVLWERTQHIPDEACQFITDAICDAEKMPMNMSREIRQAWGNWKAANPERMVRHEHCDACGDTGQMWFFWPDEQGHMHLSAEFCPVCHPAVRSGQRAPVCLQALTKAGCVVVPAGKNPDTFAAQQGFDRWQALNSGNVIRHRYSRQKKHITDSSRIDPSRVAHLPEAELARYTDEKF